MGFLQPSDDEVGRPLEDEEDGHRLLMQLPAIPFDPAAKPLVPLEPPLVPNPLVCQSDPSTVKSDYEYD